MTQLLEAVEFLLQHKISAVLTFATLGVIWISVYRICLHPLSKFPGPKLAALTIWYEFYYDGLKRGQYTFEIGRMHEKYGPVVRISPNELHVNDPSFIETLYAGGGKRRDKYQYFTAQFGIPESVFATVPHDHHRLRRGALNRFFSKASVVKLEPIINEVVQKLCSQIQTHAGSGKPVTISSAFSCMTTDIVTEYAFARSYNFLDTDSAGFEKNLHEAILAGSEIGLFVKQFPWILTVLQALPQSILGNLNPTMRSYLQFQKDMRAQINNIKESMADNTEKSGTTIFHELLNGNLPEHEKTVERLWQEGQIIIGAGTETTAWISRSIIGYHVLPPISTNDSVTTVPRIKVNNSRPYATPSTEHTGATTIPDKYTAAMFYYSSHLVYSAVICEGLRLSYGVSTRSQRVSPHEPLFFKSSTNHSSTHHNRPHGGLSKTVEYEIPAGTPVGMTSVLIHQNPDLFPNPKDFVPERWIDDRGQRRRDLEGYLLSFSKGSRQCVGINLAYAEMFTALAAVVRTFGDRMVLFETGVKDVEICHDIFVPVPCAESKGIRVVVGL